MSLKEVATEKEFKSLTKSGLVVVKYGAEWCGPCKKIHVKNKTKIFVLSQIEFENLYKFSYSSELCRNK